MKKIEITENSGFLFVQTPGQPSLLSYRFERSTRTSERSFTVINGDSGMNLLQLHGPEADEALVKVRSLPSVE